MTRKNSHLEATERSFGFRPILISLLVSVTAWLGLAPAVAAAEDLPTNIDCHLQHYLQESPVPLHQDLKQAPNARSGPSVARADTAGRFDPNGRVLVHIHLNGEQILDAVENSLGSLNVKLLASNTAYRQGIATAYLTADQVKAVARLNGIRAVTMEPRPRFNVGKVTSQGAEVLRTDSVNNQLGFKGLGIKVGVLSNSFDQAYLDPFAILNPQPGPVTTAADDVQSGDLPVVDVLEDHFDELYGVTDEGRAMCQIVYDLAPHCQLAFATAEDSEVQFANNIVALRTEKQCDVIVDDVSYFDEPVFSDGLLAQTVDKVATSKTLSGKPVVYASSAGNDGDNGYRSDYRALSDQAVRASGKHGNLQLDPAKLNSSYTAGGWHNFSPSGGYEPSTTVTVPGDSSLQYAIFLQWNDLFDENHGVSADFKFLVFSSDGNFIAASSGTTNTFNVEQPFQIVSGLQGGTTYQIAITRTTQRDPKASVPGTYRFAMYTNLDSEGDQLTGPHFHAYPLNVPTTFGHAAATSAIGVAAYRYDWTGQKPYRPTIEDFTAPGPVSIYFDKNNQRLEVPEGRIKPDVAGVDGVATTFFGASYNGSPYSFFGTSAAAPHIAGVAALMIQAAGGPGKLDPGKAKSLLKSSAPARDLDPLFCQALATSTSGQITVSAQGEVYSGPNYFKIAYTGRAGQSVDRVTIDGTKAGVVFDTTSTAADQPLVGTLVGLTPPDVTILSAAANTPTLAVQFKKGAFTTGKSVSFRVEQNSAVTKAGGNSADEIGGAQFTATLSGGFSDVIQGTFQNQSGKGVFSASHYYMPDGYGLVDGLSAVQLALPAASKSTPVGASPPLLPSALTPSVHLATVGN